MGIPPGSVWLDARAAQSPTSSERGLGRHVVEVIEGLHRIAPEVIGSVRIDPDLPFPSGLEWLRGSGLLEYGLDEPTGTDQYPAIFHIPSPFENYTLDELLPRWMRRRSDLRTVATVHDLIPMVLPDLYLEGKPLHRATYTARTGLLSSVDHVFSISESTARDAHDMLGVDRKRITVIGSGVSDRFSSLIGSPEDSEQLLAAAYPSIRAEFLLYVGGGDARKNLEGAIEAFARLPDSLRHEHQLVMVGDLGAHPTYELTMIARRRGVDPDDLVFAGFVPDRELAAMYHRCALFVFPSLYEGFGLPILEAMSCGAPVAASNNSSIPEVLGDMDATFDPADPDDIAGTIKAIFDDPARLDALRERSRSRVGRFTWTDVAAKTLEGYEKALATRPLEPGRRSRSRIAVFTAWPPDRSTEAVQSARLVESLLEHADIDVIVPDGKQGIDRSLEPHVRFWSASSSTWLDELRRYDRFLYVLGSAPVHAAALEGLLRSQGVAVVHDVRLIGLYLELQRSRHPDDPSWLREKLIQRYGYRARPLVSGIRRVADPEPYISKQIYLTQEVQERAERVLVHSRYQADVLRLEDPGGGTQVELVPAGVPVAPVARNGTPGSKTASIVSIGEPSLGSNRLAPLIEAFAKLRSDGHDARLVLMGADGGGGDGPDVRRAAELGIGDSVEVKSGMDKGEYWSVLRTADLAVQLSDDPGGGGVSSAVSDCIAARVPAIVSSLGWPKDLPSPVAVQVDPRCTSAELAAEMGRLLGDGELRVEILAAQDRYAAENSFSKVAARYAELLSL